MGLFLDDQTVYAFGDSYTSTGQSTGGKPAPAVVDKKSKDARAGCVPRVTNKTISEDGWRPSSANSALTRISSDSPVEECPMVKFGSNSYVILSRLR